jgi:Protein of unknown function (DUF2807).
MKKNVILLAFLLFVGSLSLTAQNREKRNVGDFTKIAFRIPGEVHLRQGSSNSVEIEGPKDILEIVETETDGSTLRIHSPSKWNWNKSDRVTLYITVKTLEGVSVAGSGNLIGETKFKVRDLDVKVSGSGSLKLDIDASGEVEADVSGSGNLHLRGSARELDSDLSGSGRVILDMTIDGEAEFAISGSGRIEARGKARDVSTSISGSGRVLASDLEAKRCKIRISGSGGVEIHVTDELDANISGSGSVAYKGNPARVNAAASGSGRVRKM